MTVLEDPPAAPQEAAAARVPAQRASLQQLPLAELRDHRAELRRESARARRWQRLVQARLDLATDALDPAEELAGHGGPEGGADGLRGGDGADSLAPVRAALRTLVQGAIVPDLVDDLREVAAARRELLAYTDQVRSRLQCATDELLARYAADPSQCLGHRPGG